MSATRMLALGVAVVGLTALAAGGADVEMFVDAWAIDCDPLSPNLGVRYHLGPCGLLPEENCTLLPLTSGLGTPDQRARYQLRFQVAVGVDPAAGHALGNKGLATIVYDVMPNECMTCGCPEVYFNPMVDAASGWSEGPDGSPWSLSRITDFMYIDSGTIEYAGYNGGWGFGPHSGLPTGGNTDTMCQIHGACGLAPLIWVPDVNSTYPGLQPWTRQGVGHGTYVFPDADPKVGGMIGGFGQVLDNYGTGGPILPGDGHWLLQEGGLDCTDAWEPGCCYGWDIMPTNAALYSPTIDYNYDVGGGFRIAIDQANMQGASFSFRLPGRVGDFDGDADVDLNDFATFALCYTNGATTAPPGCEPEDFEACDLDGDGDVDLNDFATFALAFTG